jgi:hypothetical protein
MNTYLNEQEPKVFYLLDIYKREKFINKIFSYKIKSLALTNGKEFKLLGKERLYVIKLLAKLFCFNSIEFTNEIMKLEIINKLMV